MQPSALSFLGVAKETTKGTAVAPVDSIPVRSLEPIDNIEPLPDRAVRTSAAETYNEVQGSSDSGYRLTGDVYAESIPRVLYGVLGELVTVGTTAPYAHSAAAYNAADLQPPAYTLTDMNGFNARVWPGMQFSEATFQFNSSGLLVYTAVAIGFPSAPAAVPTFVQPANPPLAGQMGSLLIGGVSAPRLEKGTLRISRPVRAKHNVDSTRQGPWRVWAGPLSVNGSLTLTYSDDTDLNNYLANASLVVVLAFATGAGAALRSIQFTMSNFRFMKGTKLSRSGIGARLEGPFEADANTTDAGSSGGSSPIKISVQNAVTGYTT